VIASRSWRRKLTFILAGLFLVLSLAASALTIWALEGPLSQPYCGERPPFRKPLSSQQAVFIARAVYVGRIDREYAAHLDHKTGNWALASVQHRYWGLPWWSSQLVLLSDGAFEEGEEYFVDGDRSSLISSFVPIVHLGTCNRSGPLERADIDLRVLREGTPVSGIRIIGRVVRQPLGQPPEFAQGIRVEITGPRGTVVAISDERGIYDANGLPPGHYSLDVESGTRLDYLQSLSIQHDLNLGDVWGKTLWVK
jgi:hypothetical protein